MSAKADVSIAVGLRSGRHSRSPAPLTMRRPSLSCTASRKSSTPARRSGEKKYIEVSGAMPTVEIGRRGKSTERMCITVASPGSMVKS